MKRQTLYNDDMKKITRYYLELIQELIDCIKVGIFITDEEGNVVMLNDESEKTGGMSKSELVGKNMRELIDIGYVTDSTVLKAIQSGKEEYIIQELGDGGKMYVTGVPFVKNNKLYAVVCTERDITETLKLRELLAKQGQDSKRMANELEYLRKLHEKIGGEIIAESHAMHSVVDMAVRIAKRNATVMIKGESGTGKELVANLIHRYSTRNNEPFVKINCAAIPDNLLESELFGYEKGAFTGADSKGKLGMFELADKGTLLLDEISELALPLQSKLLRVLQEKEIMRVGGNKTIPVNVRIITATNTDLQTSVKNNEFREDLYYRLNIVPLELPPLRQRKEDIGPLAEYFVKIFNDEYNMEKYLASEVVPELKKYSWPGNVRELKNIIERIMISFDGDEINKFQVDRLLSTNRNTSSVEEEITGTLSERVDNYERELISKLLNEYKNASEVAKILGVNKSTISRKISRYKIIY